MRLDNIFNELPLAYHPTHTGGKKGSADINLLVDYTEISLFRGSTALTTETRSIQ
jgi:hypothetical protein